jgi:hypothetical protein
VLPSAKRMIPVFGSVLNIDNRVEHVKSVLFLRYGEYEKRMNHEYEEKVEH